MPSVLCSSRQSFNHRFKQKDQSKDKKSNHLFSESDLSLNPNSRENKKNSKTNQKKLTISIKGRRKPIPFIKSRFSPEKKNIQIKPKINCVFCNNKIQDFTSIAEDPNDRGLAHFDCVLKSFEDLESFEYPQHISYLGSGNYAIIEPIDYNNKSNAFFRIIRYIYTKQNQGISVLQKEFAITPRYMLHVSSTITQTKQTSNLCRINSESKNIQFEEFPLLENDN